MRKPARNPPANFDAHRIFKQAQRFHWSYERLCVGTDDAVHQMVLIPAMVLSAFASELYLKCLHHIDSGKAPGKTHALQKLFEALPSLRRQRIETLWKQYMVRHSGGLALAASHGINVPKDLTVALEDGSLGFEQLRYEYEDSNFKFYISEFPQLLRVAILEIHPAWKEAAPPITRGFQTSD